ncbi:hypothetical protein [Nocardioides convexus]|uniref:hypothetical protein n=1 Tax=Nocardioides convexus TaxID=2712224 RepID=UPI0024184752|nr:hypothetical protein [Nocardioides convexus]
MSEFVSEPDPAAPRAPVAAPPALLHRYDGPHRRGGAAQRHRLVAPRGPPDGGRRLGGPAHVGDVPQRRRHRRP